MLQLTYKSKPVYFIDDGDKRGELCIQRSSTREGDYYFIALFRKNAHRPQIFVRRHFETIALAQNYLETIARQKNLITVSEAMQQGVYKW